MARPSRELVTALRTTAARIGAGAPYAWTHLGACNCGHLAQTLTSRSKEELRKLAMERAGEWADQALEYCPGSGYPIDHVIGTMLDVGLTQEDIGHLERLSCPEVLATIPVPRRIELSYRDREHVVEYLLAWAALLEERLPRAVAPCRAA
ncbi:MAG: hypothetical protein KC776_21700 [Myxococcales bacterium]|nr:hypothetical protein [Myxococcales bacterium]MCB9575887.1 hypothetical protein [Polyangiaceae bacterium]